MPLDQSPPSDLVLAPSVQAGVERLLQAWAQSPYAAQFPIASAKIEPGAIHLATFPTPTGAALTLTYQKEPPWFVVEPPAPWPPEAAAALRRELLHAFPTTPWTRAARPEPQQQGRAAQTGWLETAAWLGEPATVPVVSPTYAVAAGVAFVALPLAASCWLLLTWRARRRSPPSRSV